MDLEIMKRFLFQIAAITACLLPLVSCQEKPQTVVEDPFIIVDEDKLEVPFDGQIFEVKVESNCTWTIAKTGAEGNAIDWVKCNMAKGNGNMALKVRVYRNGTDQERHSTITLAQNDVKAFIDVIQAANPNPDEEEPDDPDPVFPVNNDEISLFFDFAIAPLPGWPTTSVRPNVGGSTECVYPLDGKDYTFICADSNGASSLYTFWADSKKVFLSSQYCYFGLPAIEGYKLTSITLDSFFYKAADQPKIGVVKRILGNATDPADEDFVPGGEIITWEVDKTQYNYTLTDTEPNTVYYLYSEVRGGFTGLNLIYTKDEEEGAPENRTILFDFTGAPMEGWPLPDKSTRPHVDGGTPCVYNLYGEDFTFILADCDNASSLDVFWTNRGEGKTNCIYMSSQWRYFGLPAIEGLKLTKISCECEYYTASIQPKMGVVKNILGYMIDPEGDDFVEGGEIQTWETDKVWYDYTLDNTAENTVYYIYCEAKGGWKTLELTYE